MEELFEAGGRKVGGRRGRDSTLRSNPGVIEQPIKCGQRPLEPARLSDCFINLTATSKNNNFFFFVPLHLGWPLQSLPTGLKTAFI